MVSNRPHVDSETENIGNPVEVDLCDGGIDLEFNPSLFQHVDSPQGALKRTLHLPKRIMGLCVRTIEADADPLNPGGPHLLDRFIRDQCAVGGHHHAQSVLRSMASQIENVGPEERFSSCQDDHRLAERGDLIHHPEAFPCAKAPPGKDPVLQRPCNGHTQDCSCVSPPTPPSSIQE